jgi:hypothetical protein
MSQNTSNPPTPKRSGAASKSHNLDDAADLSRRSFSEGGSIPSADEAEQKAVDQGATPAQAEEIVWLVDFAHTQGIKSFAALAKEMAVSETQVSLILRGKYTADLAGFAATISHFREVWTERHELGPVVFVPQLSVVKRIQTFAEITRTTQQIGIVWSEGPNQCGISKALKFVADTKNLTAYMRLPAGGGTKPAMKALAKARGGIPTRKSYEELRDVLLKRFNKFWLIIADDFHRTISGRTAKAVTIERFVELNEESECGLLLSTSDLLMESLDDEKYRHVLAPLARRGVLRLKIPQVPTEKDLQLLIAAYGFEGMPAGKANKTVREIVNEQGIGNLCRCFNIARRLAKLAKGRIAWKHFSTSVATITSWSVGEFADHKPALPAGSEPRQLTEGSEG